MTIIQSVQYVFFPEFSGKVFVTLQHILTYMQERGFKCIGAWKGVQAMDHGITNEIDCSIN